MAHDDIPEDEAPPCGIHSIEQARVAAQHVMDWADANLSMMEAADMPTASCELAKKTYDNAKALVESLA